MKNKMKEVCELLNIKFGKNFNIKGSKYNPFYINSNGLYDCNGYIDSFTLYRLLTGELSIEKDILTDKEREYLANVIEPDSFYKNVKYIVKTRSLGKNYIKIYFKMDNISLPKFEKGESMYVGKYEGMEYDRFYTLAELGLEKKTSIYDELSPIDRITISVLASEHPINIDTVAEIYITYDKNYERTKNILYSMHTCGL